MPIKTLVKKMYCCSDGAEFQDELLAINHEAIIEHQDIIDEFLDTQNAYKSRTINMIRGVLHNFVIFKVSREMASVTQLYEGPGTFIKTDDDEVVPDLTEAK